MRSGKSRPLSRHTSASVLIPNVYFAKSGPGLWWLKLNHFSSGIRVQKVAEKFNAHRRVISNSERAESADGESGESFTGN
jgi:hypothetical protein